jgi:hypothetical protein
MQSVIQLNVAILNVAALNNAAVVPKVSFLLFAFQPKKRRNKFENETEFVRMPVRERALPP